MGSSGPLHPAILDHFLQLQSALHEAGNEEELVGILARRLGEVPCVAHCLVCIDGCTFSSRYPESATLSPCAAVLDAPGESYQGCRQECPPDMEEGTRRFALRSPHGEHGSLYVELEDTSDWDLCEPWFESIACLTGVLADNHRRARLSDSPPAATAGPVPQTEARLRALFESASDAIYLKNTDLIYVDCNEAMARLLGRSRAEILGHRDTDLFPTDEAEDIAAADRDVLAGNSIHLTYTRTLQGEQRTIETSKSPVRDTTGRIVGLCGVSRDVTDFRRLEEELRFRGRQMDLVLRGANLGTWDWNVRTGAVDFNDRWAEMLGYTIDEIEPHVRVWEEMVHPDDHARVMQQLHAHLDGKAQDYRSEHRLRHKSGEWVWVYDTGRVMQRDSHGKPLRVCGTHLDITERKQTEQQLLLHSQVLDQIQDCVTVTDLDGIITYVNRAEIESMGRALDELLGKSVDIYGEDPERGATQRSIMENTLRDGHWRGEVVNQTGDGREIVMDCRTQVVRDAEGRPIALCGISTDVTHQKQLQTDLEERLAQLTVLLGSIRHGVLVENMERRMVFANQDFCDLFGVTSPEEVLEWEGAQAAREASALFRDPARFVGDIDNTIAHGEVVVDYRLELVDGRTFERTYAPIEMDGRRFGHLWLYRDKTQEIGLERNYRTLFHEMLDGFAIHEIVWDGDGRPVDYRFLDVNPAFERLTGLGRDIIGKTVLEVLPETERHWIENYAQVARSGRPLQFSSYSGEIDKYFEVRAFRPNPDQFACIFTDITDRKRAEEERERLMMAIEQAAETVVITDVDANILYANPAFERVTGYSREEALGRNPRFLKSGEQDDSFYRSLWDTLTRGETWVGRLINRKKDGQLFTEEAVISPVRDGSGHIVNYVAVKRDVTQELKLEAQYRQAQKMEAIGQLTGGVAHDFNNLLQIINGYVDMVLDELGPEDAIRDPLLQVSRAGDRAARLVSQLLAFSRRQILRPETLDLNQVVPDLLQMLGRVIGEHIRLEWVPGTNLQPIHADRGMIEQALLNLSLNARDAMPAGGTLTIETHPAEVDEEFCATHAWAAPGAYTVLSVSDTGCGMTAEVLSHIFEPFFTTKETGKGTGLGLATVYGIIKQHGGMVHVYSEVGRGTSFKLYWPVAVTEPDCGHGESPVPLLGGTETILLAEDDVMVRELGKKILERAGYTVLVAHDGAEAVSVFEEHADRIDLAILDVVMPNLGGDEALARMRGRRPDLKVLFASGYSENAIHTDFILDDGLILLQKPFTRDALLRAVRDVLDC